LTRNEYALRRLHKAEPPDFELMLIQDGPLLAD
jgi:hypothetical protein